MAPPLPASDAPPVREGEAAPCRPDPAPALHLGAASTSERDERGDGHDEGGRWAERCATSGRSQEGEGKAPTAHEGEGEGVRVRRGRRYINKVGSGTVKWATSNERVGMCAGIWEWAHCRAFWHGRTTKIFVCHASHWKRTTKVIVCRAFYKKRTVIFLCHALAHAKSIFLQFYKIHKNYQINFKKIIKLIQTKLCCLLLIEIRFDVKTQFECRVTYKFNHIIHNSTKLIHRCFEKQV
jgi:hypothetical protein